MSASSLSQVLELVGPLDDSPGEQTARERFRNHLQKYVTDVGQLRDQVDECLRTSGDQYNRALQDLVNHLGRFLGFEVTFGRYRGVQGEVGFDGLWKSPTGFRVVVEVKTTEAYAVKTSALVGYVDGLISEKLVPSWDSALGLYVIGRPDPDLRQLQNAIVAERRTDQLRTISVDSLLSLAEVMSDYEVGHEDILAVLSPSGPDIDPIVDLMKRLVAGQPMPDYPGETVSATETMKEVPAEAAAEAEVAYWLTPVRGDAEQTAEECIQSLVGDKGVYAFGHRTPGRRHIKPGDWICFYATGKGVVAHARVTSRPVNRPHSAVHDSERYPWVFQVSDATLYLTEPVVIDAALRGKLDAFRDRDPGKAWAWFVQATRSVSAHDFELLAA